MAKSHHVASSLAEGSNPNIKANQTQRTLANQTQLQQTKHRGVYQKKKKIPNTQTKTKPSNPQTVMSPSSSPQLARHRHRCSPGRPSSQIVDRRLENADRSASTPALVARCSLQPSLKVFRSFSLWLSLSLSVFISLKLKRKWIADWHRRSVITLRLCLCFCSSERCSLLPPAVRPSLKVFLSDSLSDSQSLSLYLTE